MDTQLNGKVAVVTGATSGIGFAITKALLNAGAKVVMVTRRKESLMSMPAPLHQNSRVLVHFADLLDRESCAKLIPEILDEVGQIDILNCNAGSYIGGDLLDTNTRAIDGLLDLNVNAVLKNIHAVLPHMIEQGGGDIIVTGSVSGHRVLSHEPFYSASKHAVNCFVQAVRRQVRNKNIRVSQVSPGPVVSALLNNWPEEKLEKAIEEGSLMEASEVAEAVLYMLSRPRSVTVQDVVLLPTICDY